MAYKKSFYSTSGRKSSKLRSKTYSRKARVSRLRAKSYTSGRAQTVRIVIEQPSITSASINPNTFAVANDVKKKEAKF